LLEPRLDAPSAPGRVRHGMLFFANLMRALLICHGWRSCHGQRAFRVYHDPCRHLGLVAAQRQADEGDPMRQGLQHCPVATLRHDSGHMGEPPRMRDKGGPDHVWWGASHAA
jgi:hypothetical protein